MSSNLQINREIENYINENSLKLHPIQKEVIEYNENLGKEKKMQISISQCHFLHLIVKIYNPSNILEVGTFTGLSALSMGLAMNKDAFLTAIDKNKERSNIAKNFFVKAKIENKINLIVKNANESMKDLIKNKKVYDLIFIDADKENYINYFKYSLELINKSGLIITDNVLWHGDVVDKNKDDKLTKIIREFNSFVYNDDRVETLILPLGDGLSVCRKI
tara:strand:+ start:83 stop:739 length:657 start_codon:yes stop_codon:yes gene_type:complete